MEKDAIVSVKGNIRFWRKIIFTLFFADLALTFLSDGNLSKQEAAPLPAHKVSATAPAAQFCSAGTITVPVGSLMRPSSPYPSNITVSGLSGVITNLSVTLNTIQHTWASDIDILLVSPTGQKFVLMSDVGGGLGLQTAATFTLSDAALRSLPVTSVEITDGFYKPTNLGAGDGFYAPAPGGPYFEPAPAGAAIFASVFNGFSPNGGWQLYLMGDAAGPQGRIDGGWCVGISTDTPQNAGQIQFGTNTFSSTEGETANVVVTRSNGNSGAATVDYSITSGSATGGADCTAGVDFIEKSGTLVMFSGMRTRSITIETCPDASFESVETANVQISNPTGTQLGDAANAQIFIFESNWQKQSSNPTGQTIENLHMISPLEGWAVGGYALILHTTDGGVTWEKQHAPNYQTLNAVYFIDSQRGWAVGNEEIYTIDGGRHWKQADKSQAFSTLYQLSFADANRGFAASNDQRALKRTIDGGRTWFVQELPIKINYVNFFDSLNGLANGSEGVVITTDGGKKWFRQKVYVGASPADSLIAGIAFPNQQDGWACIRGRIGTPGTPSILKTNDSGESWQDVNKAPPHNCFALDTFDNQTIVSVGFDGGGAPIVRSTDGGQTWTYTVFNGSSVIRDVDMASANVGYMAAGARLLKSTDGFATWTTIGVSESFTDVSFADEKNGWALALSPALIFELWHTTDGGQTWDRQPMNDAAAVHDVNPATAWIVEPMISDVQHIYENVTYARRTTDGGQTFSPREIISLDTASSALFFVDADNGWIGGRNQEFPSLISDGADIFRRGSLGLSETDRTPYDFDGDGKADAGIFRPNGGEWWIQNSSGNVSATQFGNSGDKIVSADYTGDGKTDVAFWRPSTGQWFILRSENFSFYGFPFGANGDVPVSADYDGDGKVDPAVFRNGIWHLLRTADGYTAMQFGLTNDTPIPSAQLP